MTGNVRVVGSGGGGGGGTQNTEGDGGTGAAGNGSGTAGTGDDGSLPSTGLTLGPVALTGLMMFAAGLLLRRRVASTGL
jgi:hypothetical protein